MILSLMVKKRVAYLRPPYIITLLRRKASPSSAEAVGASNRYNTADVDQRANDGTEY